MRSKAFLCHGGGTVMEDSNSGKATFQLQPLKIWCSISNQNDKFPAYLKLPREYSAQISKRSEQVKYCQG